MKIEGSVALVSPHPCSSGSTWPSRIEDPLLLVRCPYQSIAHLAKIDIDDTMQF